MLAKDFNVEQRKAIAVLAFHMMVADHEAVAPEHARVNGLERDLDVAGIIAPGEYYTEPSLALFADRPSQLRVMAELFLVALADGHRHPNENDFLKRLGNDFGLSWKIMANLLIWAMAPEGQRPALDSCLEA